MRFFMLIALSILLAACAAPASTPSVNLSDLQPLPVRADRGITPLRVAVAAVISPKGTVESYQPLLDYLARALGRPVELVQRRTYAEVETTAAAEATMLAKILRLVEEAQARRSPSERWVDRFAAIYTPCVFVTAILVALLPPRLTRASWGDGG